MGADRFDTRAWGKTAKQAFNRAVKQAQYDHGHSGYTGTIAEKCDFEVFESPIEDVYAFIDAIDRYCYDNVCHIDEKYKDIVARAAKVYDDKWGPAVCIPLSERSPDGEQMFIFCGWASS